MNISILIQTQKILDQLFLLDYESMPLETRKQSKNSTVTENLDLNPIHGLLLLFSGLNYCLLVRISLVIGFLDMPGFNLVWNCDVSLVDVL